MANSKNPTLKLQMPDHESCDSGFSTSDHRTRSASSDAATSKKAKNVRLIGPDEIDVSHDHTNLLGMGGFSKVYLGNYKTLGGIKVAVKNLKLTYHLSV